MNENAKTAKLIKILNQIPQCYAQKRHGGRFQSGDPDVAGTYRGKSFFIECKELGGTLTALQADKLSRHAYAGAAALVAIYVGENTRVCYPTLPESWGRLVGPVKNMRGDNFPLDIVGVQTWLEAYL